MDVAKAAENLHLATEVATEEIVQDGEETKKFNVQCLKFAQYNYPFSLNLNSLETLNQSII
jgi:hypothetical protein